VILQHYFDLLGGLLNPRQN